MESQKELKKAFFSNPEFSLQVAQNASRIVWGKKRETATSFLSKQIGKHKKARWNTSFNNTCWKSNFY